MYYESSLLDMFISRRFQKSREEAHGNFGEEIDSSDGRGSTFTCVINMSGLKMED